MHRPWLLELEKKETDFQVVPQSSLHEVQEPLVQVTMWASLAFASSWFSHEFLSHMFHWSLVHGFLSQCCLMLSLYLQMLIHTSRHTPFQEQPNPTSPVPPALAPVSEPVYSTVPISPFISSCVFQDLQVSDDCLLLGSHCLLAQLRSEGYHGWDAPFKGRKNIATLLTILLIKVKTLL